MELAHQSALRLLIEGAAYFISWALSLLDSFSLYFRKQD